MAHPVNLAAQAAGVKAGDMPDLTIKEAKIYVTDPSGWRNSGAGLSGGGEIASMVTASGIEGNFTLGNRGNPPGWVDFAKSTCVGKNLYDILPTVAYIPNQTRPERVQRQEAGAEPVRRAAPEEAVAAAAEGEGSSADSTRALPAGRVEPRRMCMLRPATSSCGTSWARP